MVPRDMRLKKLQLVIDEQLPTRINPDSFNMSGEAKNLPQTLRAWHTTRHTFHSEIGARSVLRVVDEVFRTDELW